jgi:hypothetical protein
MTEQFNKRSHSLLGNCLIKKHAVARLWLAHMSRNNRGTVGGGVFYAERINILVMDLEETVLAKASSNLTDRLTDHPLVREGASHEKTRNCLTVTKTWSWGLRYGLTPRWTG